MRILVATCASLALVACDAADDRAAQPDAAQTSNPADDYGYQIAGDDNQADTMASRDLAPGEPALQAIPDSEERPVMQLQVVLDRRGFGPGVIDGKMGQSTENALRAFQQASGLDVTGKHDEATKKALSDAENIPATRVVRIPADWGEQEYKAVPDDPAEQAEMEQLGYTSLDERLAERFHTTVEVLKELNPDGIPAGTEKGDWPSPTSTATPSATPTSYTEKSAEAEPSYFTAGQNIRVPNVGSDRIKPGAIENRDWQRTLAALGVGSEQPKASRIVVSESEGTLKAYDGNERLIAAFTVTTGSKNDPLPIGEWGITGVGRNPPFKYQPELFWDVPDDEDEQMLPPGPNGPVGVVWIDLTKEHYGIHGTPEPQTIGRTQSHGCVRLTNWDAARLSQMVSTKTKVIFES